MRNFRRGLIRAKPIYVLLSPGWPACFKNVKWLTVLMSYLKLAKLTRKFISLRTSQDLARFVFHATLRNTIVSLGRGIMLRQLLQASSKESVILMGRRSVRSWFSKPIGNDRIIKRMRVVFHDANKAGKHIDVHIGHFSIVINIAGKPIADTIKYNANGELTVKSKLDIINLLRKEVNNGSRMIQNADHTVRGAMESWKYGERGIRGYGAGKTRQNVLSEHVEIMSVDSDKGQTIKMYSPTINSDGMLYIHKLYKGDKHKPPVLIWGRIKSRAPMFNGKPNLKPVKTMSEFVDKVDIKSVTRKYDGASANFKVSPGGVRLWSPRISKSTGDNIEYTHKVPEIFRSVSTRGSIGIGELLFKKKPNILDITTWFNRDRYLSAAEIGGILNSNNIRPRNVVPDLRVYRVDRYNGDNVSGLPFFENRSIQGIIAELSDFINLPELVYPEFNNNWEGLVAVVPGGDILNGVKIKFWGDSDDWEVESVNLGYGPTGRTAGVVWFKSITSGKRFKLGPGQIGTEQDCIDIMKRPHRYIGRVAKVRSRRGHEGRASKLIEWHLDKGFF